MSSESSPSPQASSSLKAPNSEAWQVGDVKEEDMEVDVESLPATSSSAVPANAGQIAGLDLNALYQIQNDPALRSFLAGNTHSLSDLPNLAIAKLFSSPQTVSVKQEAPHPEMSEGKRTRPKVFANGFFMTFDKVSSCGQKKFWRCEYKNTCKARMHSDVMGEKILSIIHKHNHPAPVEKEVRLFGIDPNNVDKNKIYPAMNPVDPNLRRKIRKQNADREAALKRLEAVKLEEDEMQQSQNAINASRAALQAASAFTGLGSSSNPAADIANAFSGSTGAAMSSMLMAHLPFIKRDVSSPAQVSPNLPLGSSSTNAVALATMQHREIPPERIQGLMKRRVSEHLNSSDDDEFRLDPLFDPTFEIARKLRKLWKGEPSRYPRTTANATTHFEFFIAKDDGSDEHLYMPIQIKQRDEMHLKEALQNFINSQCIGMLLFGVSPKISVMFNQPMLSDWDNNQYFLLNVSNPTRWRLTYVDDRAV